MSNINNGGPAFPLLGEGPNVPCFNEGMTLRDYFAAAALQGLLAYPNGTGTHEVFAKCAYAYADAMLVKRAQSGGAQ